MTQNLRRQKKTTLLPVILAGGVGSRLWPLSRAMHPKPFIKLDNQSLIQKTYLRAAEIDGVAEIVTVTNRELFFYTRDEYEALSTTSIFNSFILEPFGRNSAAAIALAAHYAQENYGGDCTVLILPADHLIENQQSFQEAIKEAMRLAAEGKLVTFGMHPHSPNTGYGYIEMNGDQVQGFVEKPDFKTAQGYLDAGNYLWNSGMFCLHADTITAEMHRYCPDIVAQTATCLKQAHISKGSHWLQCEILAQDFASLPDLSVDYAVFEKSNKVAVVSCDIGWSDIGSWVELGQRYPKDQNNNHILGETVLQDVQNCIIHADQRLVAGVGLTDLVIIDTQDALLVASKNGAQEGLRAIVKTLQSQGHDSYQLFKTVHRPWGSYTVLQESVGFKLKRIEMKPGAALSLQSHNHRSEHWVVVSGSAQVVNGDQTITLERNQSTFIPVGNKHRLKNIGTVLLTLIEVQCGNYLGEDDILRYEDVYGRNLVDGS